MDEIKEKLRKLKEQRRLASHKNFKEVLEENEKSKRPPNWELKVERDRKLLVEEEEKLKAEKSGQDYYLKKSLDVQADELEKWEKFRASKKRRDPGFIDFEAATKRQYDRLTRQMSKSSDDKSTGSKNNQGEILPTSSASAQQVNPSTSTSGVIDTEEGAERLAQSVKEQIEIRNKRSRRRRFDDDADVDYINERNMRYNKKLERFYGDHTAEIKQNFERGTAL